MTNLTLLPLPVERASLAATAISAAGGGELLRLRATAAEPGVWHAEVVAPGGQLVDVRLDSVLGTAYAAPRRAAVSHAA